MRIKGVIRLHAKAKMNCLEDNITFCNNGLGFNGVVIDLQHHFQTCTNYQNLPKISTKIYDNCVDSAHLRAVESQPWQVELLCIRPNGTRESRPRILLCHGLHLVAALHCQHFTIWSLMSRARVSGCGTGWIEMADYSWIPAEPQYHPLHLHFTCHYSILAF